MIDTEIRRIHHDLMVAAVAVIQTPTGPSCVLGLCRLRGWEMARPGTMRVCPEPGCPELTPGGPCPAHARARERRRGTRQQRGYDAEHERLRARWQPKVDRASVHCHAKVCLMPARLILPGQPWDLGHNDDRTAWTGPEHARCNRSAGGKAAHAE